MKPRNKFQKQVFEASKALPLITAAQKEWVYQNCFKKYGYRSKTGIITCLDCGHKWQGNSELSDTLLGGQCPACCAKLTIQTTQKRVLKEIEYMSIITVCNGLQVIRFFHIEAYYKKGKKAHYEINEIVQRWITPNGRTAVVARTRPLCYNLDTWTFGSSLEIRNLKDHHNISTFNIYPRQRLIPELKRNGYTGNCYGIAPYDLFADLLTNSKAETLLKAGQVNALKYFVNRDFGSIDNYWASIKICIRNGYTIHDTSIWCDYINLLGFFGKDLNNAKYVCPDDLKAEHDRYVQKKRAWQERRHMEEKQKKALEQSARFNKMKSHFFGIVFTDGVMQVRVLESVEEVMQEGDILKHCVFTNEYHLRPDSLILSATIDGKRIETIEFSISKLKVVQCRGMQNQNTEYHDRILSLVNKNIKLIKKRLAA
jgi:hypothetical protein